MVSHGMAPKYRMGLVWDLQFAGFVFLSHYNPLPSSAVNRPSQRGQSAAPLLVFLGIVLLSVIFFFVFTMPQGSGKQTTVTTLPQTVPVPKPVAPPTAPVVVTPPPTVITPPKPFYMKSSQFLSALAEHLRAGKLDEAMELMAPTVPQAKQEFFKKLFTTGGYKPGSGENPWQEIGRMSGQERWQLPLSKSAVASVREAPAVTPPAVATLAAPPIPTPVTPVPVPPPGANESGITLTVGEPPAVTPEPEIPAPTNPTTLPGLTSPVSPVTAPNAMQSAAAAPTLALDLKLSREEGYQIMGLHFSSELLRTEGGSTDRSLADVPDPLSISHGFLTEVLGKNFRGARAITDGTKVTHEKLAGLCIVFEEGDYKMVPGSSLNVTAATPDRAWALVRVKGATHQVESEFGVEMARNSADQWKVDSLDFSKLLQNYVQATDGGKVYYSPIVKSPSGGESLVVYFEYDKSELNDRGMRQMEIVADLLKSDPARKMRLSGYTDALGAEDYNNQLSKKRAEAVRTKLAQLGVDPAQIVSRGYGSDTPLDPNQKDDGSDNPEGRSRNRRTEIYLDF